MEKQTKILLGIGAVIAAYLILKPKMATVQTDVPSLSKDKIDLTDVNPTGSDEVLKALEKVIDPRQHQLFKYPIQNCNCIQAPCNCGGGGVKLDVLIPNQSSEY